MLFTTQCPYALPLSRYRIRQLTEKEQAVKVSKEVKQLREFEQGLLRNYELYLKDLDSALISKSRGEQNFRSLSLSLFSKLEMQCRKEEGVWGREITSSRRCKVSLRIVDNKDLF